MTKPQQLEQWRAKFELTEWRAKLKRNADGSYTNNYIEGVWQGYLRRCQETADAVAQQSGQIMKLAKFGAHILSNYQGRYVSDTEIGAAALVCECIMDIEENNKFAPNIEVTIEELIK